MNFEYFLAQRLQQNKFNRKKTSSAILKIAIVAIAISLVMMLVSIATGLGLQQKIREKVVAFSGHITISSFENNQSESSLEPLNIQQNFYPNFTNIQGIKHVQAVATKTGIIRTEKTFEGVVFKGIGTDYDPQYLKEYLVEGRFPKIDTTTSNEVLLSAYLANRLELKVGSKFKMFFLRDNQEKLPFIRQFTLVGIYNSDFQDFDSTYLIGDLKHIQRMNKWQANQAGSFEVFINDFTKIEEIGQQVYQEIPPTLNSKTITEKYFSIFEWLKLFDTNILIILLVMIIVATINMAVALLVLILERTQMIGVLKALGATNWQLRKVFLYNAFYLIIRGLIWGNAIALLLLFVQKYFKVIQLPPESYYVNTAPVYISFDYFLAVNLGTICICLLVLLLPSYIITKISPAKAIRFD